MAHTLTEADLAQFSNGTDQWYRHWLGLIYSDGIKYMAEAGGAYWLIDVVASYQAKKKLRSDPMLRDFQVWELNVKDQSGVVTCKADGGIKPVIRQKIEYTDFPLPYIKLWVERDEQLKLFLPSER